MKFVRVRGSRCESWSVLWWIILLPLVSSSAQASPSILILNSYQIGNSWTDEVLAGQLEILRQTFSSLDPSIEFMDWKRFPTTDNIQRVENLLIEKYKGIPFDLLIANDNAALDFLMKHRELLGPEAPIVFAGVNGFEEFREMLPSDVVGVAESINPGAALEVALSVHSATQRVVIIHDRTESGLSARREIDQVLGKFAHRVSFEFLDTLSLPEILSHVARLPTTALVYLLFYNWDADGTYYTHDQAVRSVTDSSAVPVYHTHSFALGHGIIGGLLLDGREHGKDAGRIAVRLLRGESFQNIGGPRVTPCRPVFDYHQLRRFSVPLSRIPAHAHIVNLPDNPLRRYAGYFLGAAISIIVLIGLNIALFVNVRRRKEAEAELRESENRYRLLSSITADYGMSGAVQADGSVVPEWAHHGKMTAFGYPFDQLNTPEKWLAVTHPEDRTQFDTALRRVKSGESVSIEVRVFTKTGDMRWVSHTISPLNHEGTQPSRIISAIKDITEKKHSEHEQRNLEEQLVQSRKMEALGRVTGGIAHDFNNMLLPILLNAESLLNLGNLAVHESADEIRNAALRARELVGQLLAFSRKQMVNMVVADLSVLVRDFEKILRRTIREDIRIDLLLHPSPLTVRADASRVNQILLNLAVNAQDAMPRGGVITMRTYICHDVARVFPEGLFGHANSPCAVLSLEDTGTGMDEETRIRLFEPFFTTKEQGRGTGLGLSTVYGIVKQHGGAIHVQTCAGAGTLFSVLFPLVTGPVSSPGPEKAPSALDRAPAEGITIALAEDDPAVARVVSRVLVKNGYRVIQTSGPGECIEALNGTHKVDLLLTDVIMPSINGVELYARLRESRPTLKVIYMSGYPQDVLEHQDAFDLNVGYLSKPFSAHTLLAMVRSVLDR